MQDNDKYARFNSDPVPKKVQSLYDGRIRQFTDAGGQYRDLNLPHFYDRQRLDGSDNVKLEVWSVPDFERPRFHEAMKRAEWKPAHKGDSFGPSWSTHWFKIDVLVPAEWKKHPDSLGAFFDWDSSDEGFVFSESGEALQGLTNSTRREWQLPQDWLDGKWHRFYIETSCNELQGDGSPPNNNRYFRLNTADLVLPNVEARALYIDFWIIGDASREFPGNSWQKHLARDVLNRIINAFDRERPDETIPKCREIAREYIGEHVDSPDVYKSGKRDLVWGIGNCHIDTAWLWPYGETHRKIGRSWASQIDLIERYPEYSFVASQLQQFKWCRHDYPDLFKKIQKAAKDGRFVPIGGSWVECDTNMPSGEAMARQMLLGQRHTESYFGFRTRTFWLPDTFGYSPQVPQLCRLAEMDRFLTQKLSWNNINEFPHSTFNWVALDGSQVLCHMPPDNTYTAPAHFGDVNRSLLQHKNLDVHQQGLLLFGHGDGGGGPTAEMLEKLRRCRGLSDTVDLLPRVRLGQSIDEFYDTIAERTDNGKNLVAWVGELYLEFHRGTYTTQAAIKKGNRYSEILMHDIELLATLASITNPDYKYPTAEIDALWQDVCLNQFHDVLPGSGIEMIYKDARAIYDKVRTNGKKVLHGALRALGFGGDEELYGEGELCALNTLPWGRNEVHVDETGQQRLVVSDGGRKAQAHHTTPAPPDHDKPSPHKPRASVREIEKGVFVLENDRLRVKVEGGALTSVWDRHEEREVLADGAKGNQLYLFDDQPTSFPAWDTEQYATESYKILEPGSVKITENGPLRASVEVEQTISDKSKIKTTISLDAYVKPRPGSSAPDASYVEFNCVADWHETYKFLKAEFPVDVRCDTAAYETQFGYHRRPTHYNTSWDVAKFEVCAHKWADLSEHSYGVAILNDCKYGYSIHGNRMRISLLRAPKSPDAHADMGKHTFRYALFPHSGPLDHNVVRAAYNFNHPLHLVRGKTADAHKIFRTFTLSGSPSLVISSIKRHEDDDDVSSGLLPSRRKKAGKKSVVIRVYDSLGGRARGHIVSTKSIAAAWKTNILEDDLEKVDVLSDADRDKIPIELRPFEVATYRLELA